MSPISSKSGVARMTVRRNWRSRSRSASSRSTATPAPLSSAPGVSGTEAAAAVTSMHADLPPPDFTNRTAGVVLVVDDVRANRALLERLLTPEGYIVVTAANGEDALREARRVKPDVVLADVVMPVMDGFELCRAIKADPSGYLTPVVLVTSLHGRSERIRGIEVGADDFIVKPFDAEELRARIRSLVRLKRSTDDLDCADAVILSLAMTVEARDPCTQGHCERLARWAVGLGERVGLGAADLSALDADLQSTGGVRGAPPAAEGGTA